MESEKAKSDRIARQREYYLKHRDKMLAYSRKYHQGSSRKAEAISGKCSQETSQRHWILSEILSAQQRNIAGKV